MRKSVIIALIVAVACLVVGSALSCAAILIVGFDFNKLGAVEITSGTIEINEDFTGVVINIPSCDVKVYDSSSDIGKINYQAAGDLLTEVREDGMLYLELSEPAGISFDFSFTKRYVEIYLPSAEYEMLSVNTASGDVLVYATSSFMKWKNANLYSISGNISLISSVSEEVSIQTVSGDIMMRGVGDTVKTVHTVSTSGDVILSAVYARDIDVKTTSGDIELRWVNAENHIASESVSGDLELDVEAATLSLKTTSGDVEGSIEGAKEYVIDTVSGSIHVPKSEHGTGICKIITTSGDINIRNPENGENPFSYETTIHNGLVSEVTE